MNLLQFLLLLATASFLDLCHGEDREPAGDDECQYYAQTGKCGGTLIYEDIVVSAAHCGGWSRPGRPVWLGHNFRNRSDAEDIGTIAAARTHPSLDLVVVQLVNSSTVAPVRIASADLSDDPPAGCNATTVGFGWRTDGVEPDDVLMKINMEVYEEPHCRRDDEYICARTMTQGTCDSDSGGPLLNLQGAHLGLHVWASRSKCQGGFIRFSAVRPFLDQAVCEMSNNPPLWCNRRDLSVKDQTEHSLERQENSIVPALCLRHTKTLECV